MSIDLSEEFVRGIKNGEIKSYKDLFHFHYKDFCFFAQKIVDDYSIAEDIVQDSIIKVWNNRQNIDSDKNLLAYFKKIIHNEALNYLKHRKVEIQFQKFKENDKDEFVDNSLFTHELDKLIKLSIESLSPKTKEIFQLSRVNDLKYNEIANKMDISVKTVEYHMSKALNILSLLLKDYLKLFILISYFFRVVLF